MFLSFIVPVFNTEEYLAQCLDSLLAQDIADYEILCVDDGSTDDSAAILDAYAHSHSNLLVIHQPNSGVAAARNAGLSAARGKYIWFVDSDDLIRENVLSMLVRRLEETDCDLLEIGGYQFVRTLSDEEKAMGSQLPDNVPGPGSVVWRSLIRREFLQRHDLRFRHPELTHGEDGQFMYELSMENPRVASLDAPLYFYRLRSGSAETAASDQSRLRRMQSHAEVAIIMGKLRRRPHRCQNRRPADGHRVERPLRRRGFSDAAGTSRTGQPGQAGVVPHEKSSPGTADPLLYDRPGGLHRQDLRLALYAPAQALGLRRHAPVAPSAFSLT